MRRCGQSHRLHRVGQHRGRGTGQECLFIADMEPRELEALAAGRQARSAMALRSAVGFSLWCHCSCDVCGMDSLGRDRVHTYHVCSLVVLKSVLLYNTATPAIRPLRGAQRLLVNADPAESLSACEDPFSVLEDVFNLRVDGLYGHRSGCPCCSTPVEAAQGQHHKRSMTC